MHDIVVNDKGAAVIENYHVNGQPRRQHDVDEAGYACGLPYMIDDLTSASCSREVLVPLGPETEVRLSNSRSISSLVANIQTAWSIVLQVYTGDEDVLFGYLQLANQNITYVKYECRATRGALQTVQAAVDHFENQFLNIHQSSFNTASYTRSKRPSRIDSVVIYGTVEPDYRTVYESFPGVRSSSIFEPNVSQMLSNIRSALSQ